MDFIGHILRHLNWNWPKAINMLKWQKNKNKKKKRRKGGGDEMN